MNVFRLCAPDITCIRYIAILLAHRLRLDVSSGDHRSDNSCSGNQRCKYCVCHVAFLSTLAVPFTMLECNTFETKSNHLLTDTICSHRDEFQSRCIVVTYLHVRLRIGYLSKGLHYV